MPVGKAAPADRNAHVGLTSHREVTANRVLVYLVVGIICGFLSAIMSIGAASLVVATQLTTYLPNLIGIALFSAGVLTLVLSLLIPENANIATVQTIPGAALGAVVGATVANMSVGEGNLFITAMVAVSLGTTITGIGMLVLGYFRLGEIVRYIPYPVVGGFLAGTGWIIILGGLGIVLVAPASLALFTSIPGTASLVRLGLAILFVLVLVLLRWRFPSPLVLPAVIFFALVAFNVTALMTGATYADLHADNWLIALPESGRLWHGFDPAIFSQVDWLAVAKGMQQVPALVVLTTVGLLIKMTAIELDSGDHGDLSHDLRTEGIANIATGVLGGLAGAKGIAPSAIATRFNADSRWVGVIAAATMFATLVFGTHLLDIFPTFILGGILIWVGGSLLIDWLVVQVRRIGYWDLAIIFMIFVAIVAFDFEIGIPAGLVAAAGLFIYRYSQVDIIRRELTGADYRSGVVGSAHRQNLLRQYGDAIVIVRLQGFLFFGTANRFRLQMEERMRRLGAKGRGFLVIDFHDVTGIDSSASASFMGLRQAATSHNITIVLTGLAPATRRAASSSDLKGSDVASIHVEPDLESGVEWCEDTLLAELVDEASLERRPLKSTLADVLEDREAVETIAGYCERSTANAGTTLVEQGTPATDIFFIESGHGSVEVSDGDGKRVHVATVGAGDIIGEIAFYLEDERSASVVAKDEMVIWRLPRESVLRLRTEAPAAALQFHQGMAALLSKRLARTSRHVTVLGG